VGWWRERFGRAAAGPPAAEAVPLPARNVPDDAGRYQPLYVYLRDRYADRVVLSFADIEALLGFPLPETAWTAREWWAGPDAPAGASAQSGAWTRASRSAAVNVAARNAVFDRLTPARADLRA
jgi:hypothetical protein